MNAHSGRITAIVGILTVCAVAGTFYVNRSRDNPENIRVRCVGLWKSNNRRVHFSHSLASSIRDHQRVACLAGGVVSSGVDPRYKEDSMIAKRYGVSAPVASKSIFDFPEGFSTEPNYNYAPAEQIDRTTQKESVIAQNETTHSVKQGWQMSPFASISATRSINVFNDIQEEVKNTKYGLASATRYATREKVMRHCLTISISQDYFNHLLSKGVEIVSSAAWSSSNPILVGPGINNRVFRGLELNYTCVGQTYIIKGNRELVNGISYSKN